MLGSVGRNLEKAYSPEFTSDEMNRELNHLEKLENVNCKVASRKDMGTFSRKEKLTELDQKNYSVHAWRTRA